MHQRQPFRLLGHALLECVDGRGTLARLEQRRQFSQRAQPEIVEKLARGAEQLGPPEEIYERPRTTFVAGFIGVSNLMPGEVVSTGAGVPCWASTAA